jgi:hypothetical protein
LVELGSFDNSYTLNFHLQALVRSHGIENSLLLIHEKDRNSVALSLAQDENSFFIS